MVSKRKLDKNTPVSTTTSKTGKTGKFQPRPFATPPQLEKTPQSQESRTGYNLGNVPMTSPESNSVSPSPSGSHLIQPKLAIRPAGDRYEQEADRVAHDVVQRLNTRQPQESQPQEPQRRDPTQGNAVQMKSLSQDSSAAMMAPPELETSIQAAKGGGQFLPNSIREPMEQEFGANFAGVKIHTDSASNRLNQSIQAKAFTTGSDIFFRQGAYQPTTPGGQELLAHELTHVVQQGGQSAIVQRVVTGGSSMTFQQRRQVFEQGNNGTATQNGQPTQQAGGSGQLGTGVRERIAFFESWAKGGQEAEQQEVGQQEVEQQEVEQEIIKLDPSRDFVASNIVSTDSMGGGAVNDTLYKVKFNFSVKELPDGDFAKIDGESLWFFKPMELEKLEVLGDDDLDWLMDSDDEEEEEEQEYDGNDVGEDFNEENAGEDFDEENAGEDDEGYYDLHPSYDSHNRDEQGNLQHEGASHGIEGRNPRLAERNVAAYELDKLLGGNTIVASFIVKLDIPEKKREVRGLLMQGASGREAEEVKLEQLKQEKLTETKQLVGLDLDRFDWSTQLAFSRLSLLDIILANYDRHIRNFFIGEGTVSGIDNDLILGALFGEEKLNELKGQSMTYAGYYPDQLPVIDGEFAQRVIELAQNPQAAEEILNKNFVGKMRKANVNKMKEALVERLQWLARKLQEPDVQAKFMDPKTLKFINS